MQPRDNVAPNITFPIHETVASSGLMRRRCMLFYVYTRRFCCKQPCLTLQAAALHSVKPPLRYDGVRQPASVDLEPPQRAAGSIERGKPPERDGQVHLAKAPVANPAVGGGGGDCRQRSTDDDGRTSPTHDQHHTGTPQP